MNIDLTNISTRSEFDWEQNRCKMLSQASLRDDWRFVPFTSKQTVYYGNPWTSRNTLVGLRRILADFLWNGKPDPSPIPSGYRDTSMAQYHTIMTRRMSRMSIVQGIQRLSTSKFSKLEHCCVKIACIEICCLSLSMVNMCLLKRSVRRSPHISRVRNSQYFRSFRRICLCHYGFKLSGIQGRLHDSANDDRLRLEYCT